MSKATLLFDLIMYVNTKRNFTAEEVAKEFKVSLRTAHRYLMELGEMGVPLYTEPGRNGGYRLLHNRMLPPILFNENEAFAIFFAFQSLKYYNSLPFEIDIKSVSRKLYANLPTDTKSKIDQLDLVLSFWNKIRNIPTLYIKEFLEAALEHDILNIKYQSQSHDKTREIAPIGLYAYDGFWYSPAIDMNQNEIRLYRLDRIITLTNTHRKHDPGIRLDDWLEGLIRDEPKDPLHLYATLTREGIRQASSQPWLEPHIIITDPDHGYIDMNIDRNELSFVANYFLLLSTNAKVLEPSEIKAMICERLQEMLTHYNT